MSGNSNHHPPVGRFVLTKYSLSQLAKIYGMDRKTFRKWLAPFQESIGERIGHFYNPDQVLIILRKLGLPGTTVGD